MGLKQSSECLKTLSPLVSVAGVIPVFRHNLNLKGSSPKASCHSAHHRNNNVVTEMKCETQQQLWGTQRWRMAEIWGRRPFRGIECQQQPIRGQLTWLRTNQKPGNISSQFINCNPSHANPPEFCFNDCPQLSITVHYTRPGQNTGTGTQIAMGWENRIPRVRRNGECLSQMLVTIRHWRYLDTICLLSSSKLSSRERLFGICGEVVKRVVQSPRKECDVLLGSQMCIHLFYDTPHLILTFVAIRDETFKLRFLMHRINFQNEVLIP